MHALNTFVCVRNCGGAMRKYPDHDHFCRQGKSRRSMCRVPEWLDGAREGRNGRSTVTGTILAGTFIRIVVIEGGGQFGNEPDQLLSGTYHGEIVPIV